MNIFEQATRKALRFQYKGQISVEDLWNLSVVDLDNIYKQLNTELKAANEGSLLRKPSAANTALELKVSIVRYIVETKLVEAEERDIAAAKLAQRNRIKEVLANKQDKALENLSEAELLAMLKS